MLISAGVITGKKINVLPKFVAPEKPTEAAPAEPKAEAPVAEEAPAEEVAPAEAAASVEEAA
jgi:hypothetical protein